MNFSPCIIVPFYNHGQFAERLLSGLLPYGLPIVIVDDGSDATHKQALQTAVAGHDGVILLNLEHNGGKGKACVTGLQHAAQAGFSHAIQIDADCQHDFSAVPDFVRCAQKHPEALICGRPVFDKTVPKVRLYSRYLTHYLVWVETLSLAIRDSMCGFRCYPLAATVAMLETSWVGQHMDFDTDIAVRLYWYGLTVENLPVRVVYHHDASSHFRMVVDNGYMIRAHVLLLCGMIWRMPRLIRRWKAS
ncbi:MAG: glycosyl transferase [Gammaproteobacteria bacterium]|nr:MAG: glycosyl transferase [Gammaproteobacteria bacterium]